MLCQVPVSSYMIHEIEDFRENDGALLGADLVLVEHTSLLDLRWIATMVDTKCLKSPNAQAWPISDPIPQVRQ
jgi:hypothetical protein